MSAKLIFAAGVLGVGGYVGHRMTTYDPAVFAMSKAQVERQLLSARTTMPRRDGPGEIQIWAAGRSPHGVALNMRYADWAPVIACEARIDAVAAAETRVVTDCTGETHGSAIASTERALQAPMFDEHIASILNHRAFRRETVDSKEVGIVMKNMGGMRHEAMKSADEAQEMAAEQNETPAEADSEL